MSTSSFDPKDFRQAPVAAVGVVLGFLIGFLGQWVTEDDFAIRTTADAVVLAGCSLGAWLLFVVLFRLLDPDVPSAQALSHYRLSRKLMMAGMALAFGSILASAFM